MRNQMTTQPEHSVLQSIVQPNYWASTLFRFVDVPGALGMKMSQLEPAEHQMNWPHLLQAVVAAKLDQTASCLHACTIVARWLPICSPWHALNARSEHQRRPPWNKQKSSDNLTLNQISIRTVDTAGSCSSATFQMCITSQP